MRFKVQLGREEWLTYSKLVQRRLARLAKANTKMFAVNLLVWIPLGFGGAAYVAMYREYPFLSEDLTEVAAVILVGIVMLVASLVLRARIYRTVTLAEDGNSLAEHEFIASPVELRVSGPFGTAIYPWACFIERIDEGDTVYLFTDNTQALVVPLSNLGPAERVKMFRKWSGVGEP